jgi:septal ring factor EnvC (AmiA/AmiB activator)
VAVVAGRLGAELRVGVVMARGSGPTAARTAGAAGSVRVGAVTAGRLYTAAEVEAMLGQVTADRLDAFLQLAECRADLQAARHRVGELEAAAADHPSRITRLTAEVEQWADQAGTYAADLDDAAGEIARLRRRVADLTAERDDLGAAHARLAERAGAVLLRPAVIR